MLKIYAKREIEEKILEHLKEFKVTGLRIITSFPVKGLTEKVKGSNEHKVMSPACYDNCDGDMTCVPHYH